MMAKEKKICEIKLGKKMVSVNYSLMTSYESEDVPSMCILMHIY